MKKPVIHCATPDVFEAKLQTLFDLLDKALTLNAKGIEWSNKQINDRLDQLQAKTNTDKPILPMLLTETEVCSMLGIGHTKLHGLATRGDLERVKSGRGTRFWLADVEALMKNGYPPLARKEGGQKNVSGN